MNQLYTSILEGFIAEREHKKDFPHGYCNPCAKSLQRLLLSHGIESTQMFSYKKRGEGHTFLITKDGIIIDPTYGQYSKCYLRGFIGEKFPNKILQKNITPGKEFMELQQKRLDAGIYTFN